MSKGNRGVFITDGVYSRFLSPESAEALRAFVASIGTDVDVETIRSLANITGRGYRPPTTTRDWQTVYEVLQRVNGMTPDQEE